jgi:hypothetical protein
MQVVTTLVDGVVQARTNSDNSVNMTYLQILMGYRACVTLSNLSIPNRTSLQWKTCGKNKSIKLSNSPSKSA